MKNKQAIYQAGWVSQVTGDQLTEWESLETVE